MIRSYFATIAFAPCSVNRVGHAVTHAESALVIVGAFFGKQVSLTVGPRPSSLGRFDCSIDRACERVFVRVRA